ncbi:hypothetical protein D3C73_1047350 [compost metagenome]
MALAFCGEDLRLLGAFGGQDGCTAITLCAHLLFHRVLDGVGRINRLQLDAGHADAPATRCFVQDTTQLTIDLVAGCECFFEVKPAHHVTKRGSGQLFHGLDVVGDLVGCCPGIGDLEVHNGVNRDHQVVLGDDRLRRERNYLFTQVEQRQQPVDERDQDGQPRVERPLVLAEAFNDAGTGLRDDPNRADQHDDDKNDENNQHNCCCCSS